MLESRTLFERDGVRIADVACRHARGRGAPGEQAPAYALVFVRRGCFVRATASGPQVLDPTLAYCMTPGQEQRYDHPHAGGDDCTAVVLAPELVASLRGGEADLPDAPIPVAPDADLAHRMIARGAGDGDEVVERALLLAAAVLERSDPRRSAAGRPGTAAARAALADGVRAALAEDPGRSLVDLARLLAVSPHHLSRVFRAQTGQTVARHRMRLRTRAALERLRAGDDDLARVAADAGFADQSHLCRVVRNELGSTPSALRQATRCGYSASTRPR